MAIEMNHKKEKRNRIPQTLNKHLDHLTLPNEMEDLKLSSEMEIENKKVKMGSLPLI
jgi:hypothetical protein